MESTGMGYLCLEVGGYQDMQSLARFMDLGRLVMKIIMAVV